MQEDEYIIKRVEKETCCRSYLMPKGRCYDCVEQMNRDPDEEVFE